MAPSSNDTDTSKRERAQTRTLQVSGALPVPRNLLVAGVLLDPDQESERQRRMEALKAELLAAPGRGDFGAVVDKVVTAVLELERENERMGWRLLRASRYRFGRNTEKLSREELAQLSLALAGAEPTLTASGEPSLPSPSPPADEPAADAPPSPEATKGRTKRKRKAGGSMVVDDKVERIVKDSPVPEEDTVCAICGGKKVCFGHIEHQRIEYQPARLVVRAERRPKMACLDCHKDVTTAPRVEAPAVVRRVGASVLAKLLADKAALCLPLDRQRREFQRMGLDMPRKTVDSYWSYTTDLISPIAEITLATVFGREIVGTDDSHLKTLDRNAAGGTFRGHLWCFVGTDGTPQSPELVGYGYTPSWKADEIADWFSSIDGWIQCDGYAGYASEVDDGDGETTVPVPPDRRLGCCMHVRSKFHAALLARDKRAGVALKHFADLYKVEADCKAQGLDAAARGEVRRRLSLPILDAFDEWVDSLHPALLPKSPLGRATRYAINQRVFVRRCFSDGRFEIDNGRVERRIRNFAVGRRNFLFTGSVKGGERLAAVYTLVDNCTILGVDPRLYLEDVITKRERGWPISRLSELVPSRWAADHAR